MVLLDTIQEIETPEGVSLDLVLAGPAVRALAWLVDTLIRTTAYVVVFMFLSILGNFGIGLILIFIFLGEWFYPVYFEVFHNGQTIGKRIFALAVVKQDGAPVGWSESLLRNLLRTVDMLPSVYLFGLITCLMNPRFQRIGDIVAGTVVVYRDKETAKVPDIDRSMLKAPAFPMVLEEQRAVISFAERADQLSRQRLEELSDIVSPVTNRRGAKGYRGTDGLRCLAGRKALMNQEAFEQKHESFWRDFEFQVEMQTNQRGKTEGLEMFPANYRRVCKHLALAKDRMYSAHIVERLNEMAMRGHQLLYRSRSGALQGFGRFFASTFPKAVRREWRLVLLCHLLFYGPLFGMMFAVHRDEAIIYSVMPPDSVRAFENMYESSLDREPGDDFAMFGYYIYNNVGIAFRTFAGGLLAAIGSIFILLFNGVMIGSLMGHMWAGPAQDRFFGFIVGHGSFELTAIVLAGVAGFRLGLALLFPGRLSRRESLRQAGAGAVTITWGMAFMLVLAAAVEAFWSPRQFPVELKYGVGGALWLLILIYFLFAGRNREH